MCRTLRQHFRFPLGFAAAIQKDIVLNVGAELTIDVSLNPATAVGQIDVHEDISGIDTP
jgi:hypothetical protein